MEYFSNLGFEERLALLLEHLNAEDFYDFDDFDDYDDFDEL